MRKFTQIIEKKLKYFFEKAHNTWNGNLFLVINLLK
jgi:hypothetical protein